jgi:hypothetical protein
VRVGDDEACAVVGVEEVGHGIMFVARQRFYNDHERYDSEMTEGVVGFDKLNSVTIKHK